MPQDLVGKNCKEFWIHDAPSATPGQLGIDLACECVVTFKKRFKDVDHNILLSCLDAWNSRWGSPFTSGQLLEISRAVDNSEHKAKRLGKKAKEKLNEKFAVKLFDESELT